MKNAHYTRTGPGTRRRASSPSFVRGSNNPQRALGEWFIMDTLNLLHGLRFIDSFFPSGGYAYSSGLEAAVQGDQIRDGEDLSSYVEDLFVRGLGRCEAVAVGLGHDAAVSEALDVALD